MVSILEKLFIDRGLPDYIRIDNGAEFTATAVREWLAKMEVNQPILSRVGYNESFNGKLRDELLDRELLDTLHEAQVML